MTSSAARPGYTLLEVLLALGIATLVLAGLYVSMEVQLNLAQAGRERVAESALARALFSRIAADIGPALTPIRGNSTPSTTSSNQSATTATSGATPADSTTTNLNAVTPFNNGVTGDTGRLILFISRAPGINRGAIDAENLPNGGTPDVRRVVYWLTGDQGLARQEIARVTADDEAAQLPPDVSDVGPFIIGNEVDSIEFHYFDGTGWVDSWDGTSVSQDGVTPMGPPRAVKIILGIRGQGRDTSVKTFTHVVAIQSANAQPPAPTTTEGTTQ